MADNNLMADYTFSAKYAKYNPAIRRRETYPEAVDRYIDMHRAKFPQVDSSTFDWLSRLMKEKVIVGSQRGMQFGGTAIEEKHARQYNCSAIHITTVEQFRNSLWLLLCGTGVGFSVQKHHIAKLPPLSAPKGEFYHAVEDSIEGWANAAHHLMTAYFIEDAHLPNFDFSGVRPKGAALRHGGKAPGPEPLKLALDNCRKILDNAVSQGSRPIKPIEAFDLIMHLSDAVISGGIRRSATLCLFSVDDEEMMTAKTGDWFIENAQRGRANISAMITPDVPEAEFRKLFASTKSFGEPGFIFAKSKEVILNPCVSKNTLVLTENGWERISTLKPSKIAVDSRFGKEEGLYDTSDKGGFKTAVRQLYKLNTKEGYSLELTEEHQVMTQRGWVEARNLEKGDKVHIFNNEKANAFGRSFTYEQGLVYGWLLGDGCVVEKSGKLRLYFYGDDRELIPTFDSILGFGVVHQEARSYIDFNPSFLAGIRGEWSTDNKREIPDTVYKGNEAFLRGMISGLFGADGTVQCNPKKGSSIRLCQNDMKLLEVVQQLLLQFGVYSRIYKDRHEAGMRTLPDGKGGYKEYRCEATHELHISKASIDTFYKRLGICKAEKQARLAEIVGSRKRRAYKEKFTATFISLTPTSIDEVYDLTQPDTSSFVANGVVVHNCAEVTMIPTLIKDPNGEVVEHYSLDLVDDSRRQEWETMGYTFESGVQMCNLTEVNVAKCETPAQFMDACKAAAILGTMQAAYTEFPFLGSVSEQIVEREALLGVSMTGIMSNTVCDDPSTLEHAAELVKEVNKEFAKLLGIKQASRTTLVKPSGTASIVLGSSSGIHPWHAPRFIRRVQADALEPLYQFVEAHQPERCLKSVWGGEHARVIEFACEAPEGATVREDLAAVEHLEYVKYVNTHWVRTGTAVPRIEGVHHNVSCTITVQESEWQAVEDYLWENQAFFTGVSLLGGSGDYVYQQAPLQEVGPIYKGKDNEEQRKEMWTRWNKLKELGPLDFSLCVEDEDNTEIAQTVACAGGSCEVDFTIPK